MKKELMIAGLSAVLAIVVWRGLFPPKVVEKPIPHIITKFDTVSVIPPWFKDSLKKWTSPKTIHTTDTVNIIVSQTIVDTQFINVDAPPEERKNVWPLLSYHGSAKWGDTAAVSTFFLRDGRLGISRVFVPGILVAIETDSNATPKFTFEPFPSAKRTSVWTKGFWGAVGWGACTLASWVK